MGLSTCLSVCPVRCPSVLFCHACLSHYFSCPVVYQSRFVTAVYLSACLSVLLITVACLPDCLSCPTVFLSCLSCHGCLPVPSVLSRLSACPVRLTVTDPQQVQNTMSRRRKWEHPRQNLRKQSILGEGHFGQVLVESCIDLERGEKSCISEILGIPKISIEWKWKCL